MMDHVQNPVTPLRVLVELADPGARQFHTELFRAHGFEVAACGGPHTLGEAGCPLVTQGSCALVDAADVVYFDLDLNDEAEVAVFDALRSAVVPEMPVVVEVPQDVAHRHADRLTGATVIPPIDPQRLLRALDQQDEQVRLRRETADLANR
jgi:hypothetical protein